MRVVTMASKQDKATPQEEGGVFSWVADLVSRVFGGGAEETTDEYSKTMQDKMGSKLSYVHENGINFDRIGSDLIVGSCLQSAADVDTLRTEHSVGTVLCLQEDKDMQWWNLDLQPIVNRASERGDVEHVRMPIRDFDPFSLRTSLPATVKRLCEAQRANGGTAYVHCTAGLGRAPGVALAYMWWVGGWPSLPAAYDHLFAQRPCHPQLPSIRAAACDILAGGMCDQPVLISIMAGGSLEGAEAVEVSGLNIGWGPRQPLALNPTTGRWEHTAHLPIGKFLYKYVVRYAGVEGETWLHSDEMPTIDDNGNLNNYVEIEAADPAEAARRQRIMAADGMLTADEQARIKAWLAHPTASLTSTPAAAL